MNSIPKKIHYCWFGGRTLPEEEKKYIETWKKHCPDYQIIEWNEKNFDINSNKYVKEAYDAKRFAFVSDYVRLYALYNEGGIYMDTDIEVLKPLDNFLNNKAFAGFESIDRIMTGVIGAEKENKWIESLLEEYVDISFYKENGEMDLTTNVERIGNATKKNYNAILESSYQELKDLTLYPLDYFCAKDWQTGVISVTDNTYTIHHFKGSWHTKEEKKIEEIGRKLVLKYGKEKGKKIHLIIYIIYNMLVHPIKTLKKVIYKIKK